MSKFMQFFAILTFCVHTFVNARHIKNEFTTVIDILSDNVEFSTFLRVVQRKGYVSYLNDLDDFTLIVPFNSAFIDNFDMSKFDIENYIVYNRTLYTKDFDKQTLVISESVKYPLVFSGGDGDGSFEVNTIPIIESDLVPNFQNAVIQGIPDLIFNPPSIYDLLTVMGSKSETCDHLERLLGQVKQLDSMIQNATILVPSDKNFENQFNAVELDYLLNAFQSFDQVNEVIQERWKDDIITLLKNLVVGSIIGGTVDIGVKNLNNEVLLMESNELGSKLTVNSTSLSTDPNRIYDTGIAHLFRDLDVLNHGLSFDAEKYLLGLNSSVFVDEIYIRKLENLIQDNRQNLTIFVSKSSQSDSNGFARSTLLYHFVEEQIWLESEFPGVYDEHSSTKLFSSAFCSSNKRLGGNCQRLKITKSKNGYEINGGQKILHSTPYQVGNTLIYVINEALTLPGELLQSIPRFDSCSQSIFFLRQSRLLDLESNHKGYTVFLPCFDSWNKLGLNLEYIRGNSSAVELIMKNYIVDGLIYTNGGNVTVDTRNLLGESSRVIMTENREEMSSNISSLKSSIQLKKNYDVMFNQGVIHPIDTVPVPKELDISLKDLINTTGTYPLIDLIESFPNLSGILSRNNSTDFSILVPTMSSLDVEGINADYKNLAKFLKLHIIMGNTTKHLLSCNEEDEILTILGQKLKCKNLQSSGQFLQFENNEENQVRILNKGCSTEKENSCIFLIDRPLSVDWLEKEHYHFTLPIVAIGLGIVLGVMFIVSLLGCLLVVRVGKEDRPSDDESFSNDEAGNVTQPLLPPQRVEAAPSEENTPIDQGYSSNSVSKPINVSRRP
ncbi:hypothetical protein KAFR_0H03640 [Kazachstania africana CBS 2517]|uniref:FAS1 domain-containing protein n=1 Tax=Kazachstania africana (strain ATCC 22294 / BCRC 22015 / CBS 2517 / CECT 1963 / NBRC 1671 / NRRL Y-8276) TaxID=1071382 RepID=H2AYJ7_KAZAF|nr:hypothetical protein KAFR_0H03640 [Kazachstania africana CBS 2517]CCF59774.1 hypothetical protein KAFR_0H03640 [Kazachstania africana CBS 2517]